MLSNCAFFMTMATISFSNAQINFIHPGVLVSLQDIQSARDRLSQGVEPTASFMEKAISLYPTSYIAHGPPANGTISCGYYDSPNIGCSEEDEDIVTAYVQTLVFALNGNVSFAESARKIINFYSY